MRTPLTLATQIGEPRWKVERAGRRAAVGNVHNAARPGPLVSRHGLVNQPLEKALVGPEDSNYRANTVRCLLSTDNYANRRRSAPRSLDPSRGFPSRGRRPKTRQVALKRHGGGRRAAG